MSVSVLQLYTLNFTHNYNDSMCFTVALIPLNLNCCIYLADVTINLRRLDNYWKIFGLAGVS